MYQLYLYLTCAYIHVYAYTLIAVSTCFAVYDADGDTVQCRLAAGSECGCVCNVFSTIATLEVGVVIPSPVLLKQQIFIEFAMQCSKACNSGTIYINIKNIEIYIFCTLCLCYTYAEKLQPCVQWLGRKR